MKRIFNALLFTLSVVAPGISSAARSDLNGDGRSDILWYHSGVFGLISMNASGLSLAPLYAVDIRPSADWEIRGVADLNGDGKSDIVWRNKATGEIHGLLMDSATVLAQGPILSLPDLNRDIASVTDVDGDGKADLILTDAPTGALSVSYLDGLSVTRTGAVEIGANPARRIVASGDLNGDGRKELFWRDEATGAVNATFLSAPADPANAAAATDLQFYREGNANWKAVGFDDFDGDGKTDVLWRNSATGEVFLMLMNGTTVASGRMIYRESNQDWAIVATGDYDGNGKADIVWRNMATGAVYMMLMDGFTIASQGFVYTEPDRQWQIVKNVVTPSEFRSMVKGFGEPVFKLTPPPSYSDGPFTFEGSNNGVADVFSDGSVSIANLGTVTITSVQAATAKYPEIRTTVTLIIEKGAPNLATPDKIDQPYTSPLSVNIGYSVSNNDSHPAGEEYVLPTVTLSDPAFGSFAWPDRFYFQSYLYTNKSGTVTLTISLPERARWKAATKSFPVTLRQTTTHEDGPKLKAVDGSYSLSPGNQYVFDPATATATIKMCPGGYESQTESIKFVLDQRAQLAVHRLYLDGVELTRKPSDDQNYNGVVFVGTVSNVLGTRQLKRVTDPYGAQDAGVLTLYDESLSTVVVEHVEEPWHVAKCAGSGPQ
jgi:hypothetical protein